MTIFQEMSALRLEEMSTLRDQMRQHGISYESMPMPEIKIPSPSQIRSSNKKSSTSSDVDDAFEKADDTNKPITASSEIDDVSDKSTLPSPMISPTPYTKLTRFYLDFFRV